MEQEFPIRLENAHVIKPEQVMCAVLTHDSTGKEINFSYKQREDINFYISLSQSLMRLFQKVRGGVLIFVPAYSVLNKIKKVWRANKIFK
jgi:regulator of telomere elongation helicase 1